jgi:hypothetical protein
MTGEVTGDKNAQMEWKHHWWNIVSRYQVMIEGWPEAIPFCNLSETSNSIADLETLLWKWRYGKTYWKKLTSTELKKLDCEHNEQIKRGEVELPAHRHHHSDFGKTRARSNTATRTKKHQASVREISDTEGSDEESTVAPNTASRAKKKRWTSRRKVPDAKDSDEGNEVAKDSENGTDDNSPDGPSLIPFPTSWCPTSTIICSASHWASHVICCSTYHLMSPFYCAFLSCICQFFYEVM